MIEEVDRINARPLLRVKSTLTVVATVVLVLLLTQFSFALESASTTKSDIDLELEVLSSIAGGERRAKRMHRTIERYRRHLDRVKEKLAKGMDEERITGGMRHVMAMSNLSKTLSLPERDVLWQVTHRTLDLEEYLASGGKVPDSYMEEMLVIGSIFDHMPMDPVEFSVADIKIMRSERRKANELYRDGYYDAAYPLLLDLAMRGFKDSQSRLAYILFTGTENVEKSNLRALGWLGSAAFGDSEPMFRVLFKRYMDQVPEYVRPTVDKVVAGYQQSFAHDEHQNCSTEHYYASGRIKKTYCRFKLETIAEACEAGPYGGRCWAHAVNAD